MFYWIFSTTALTKTSLYYHLLFIHHFIHTHYLAQCVFFLHTSVIMSLHNKAGAFTYIRFLSWGFAEYLEGFGALHRGEVIWSMSSVSGSFCYMILQCRQIEPRLDVTPQSTGARFTAASSSPGLPDQNVGTVAPSLPGVSCTKHTMLAYYHLHGDKIFTDTEICML